MSHITFLVNELLTVQDNFQGFYVYPHTTQPEAEILAVIQAARILERSETWESLECPRESAYPGYLTHYLNAEETEMRMIPD